MKNATNSNENQEFILLEQILFIVKDQNNINQVNGNFCLGTNADKSQTIAKYCEYSLEYICKEKQCVRKCCPKYHVRFT